MWFGKYYRLAMELKCNLPWHFQRKMSPSYLQQPLSSSVNLTKGGGPQKQPSVPLETSVYQMVILKSVFLTL